MADCRRLDARIGKSVSHVRPPLTHDRAKLGIKKRIEARGELAVAGVHPEHDRHVVGDSAICAPKRGQVEATTTSGTPCQQKVWHASPLARTFHEEDAPSRKIAVCTGEKAAASCGRLSELIGVGVP
jgi:hypothetical protein